MSHFLEQEYSIYLLEYVIPIRIQRIVKCPKSHELCNCKPIQ